MFDYVDIAIVGTVMMCIGFFAGIVISAKSPKKDLRDISEISEDAMYKAEELVEKFRNLVDPREDGEKGCYFSRNKQTASAKECALIAVAEMEKALIKYGMENDELQNMDAEWRHLDKLNKFIDRYDG